MRTAVVILAFLLLVPSFTSAHEYKTTGTVTVLLHLNPNDDPVAGEPASLLFLVSDTAGRFDPARCECAAKILKQGDIQATDSFFNQDGTARLVPYVFPEKGVYRVVIDAAPRDGNAFPPFHLEYDVRVDKQTMETPKQDTNSTLWIILIGVGITVAGGAFWIIKSQNRDGQS